MWNTLRALTSVKWRTTLILIGSFCLENMYLIQNFHSLGIQVNSGKFATDAWSSRGSETSRWPWRPWRWATPRSRRGTSWLKRPSWLSLIIPTSFVWRELWPKVRLMLSEYEDHQWQKKKKKIGEGIFHSFFCSFISITHFEKKEKGNDSIVAIVKLPCVIRIITNTNELIFIMEFGWRVSLDIIFQLFSQHFNFFLSTFGLFFLIFWTFFLHFELFSTFWRFFSKCMMTKEPFSQVALTLFCRIVQDEVSVW